MRPNFQDRRNAGIFKALKKINFVYTVPAVVLLTLALWGFIFPEEMEATMLGLMEVLNETVGSVYVIATALFIGFCLYLGFGRYRHIKLGKEGDKPEYNYYTWIGLLFGAGMGVGLLFWAVAEPLSHYVEPPPGMEAETQSTAEAGLLYSVFHWGIHPWAIYATVALGLAIAKFKKDLPGLISSVFHPLLGDRIHGAPGKLIDIIAIIGTTIGVATTLGLSTMQLGGGLSEVFGLENTIAMQMVIIALITVIFITSAVTGINRGMLYLSVSALTLAAVMMVVVYLLGPTLFLSEYIINMTGEYVASFVPMTFETMPFADNEWLGEWTFFYWAWLISWSPFVGTFIARVSRGRTLQEFIIGVLFVPAFASLIWIVIFGGTGLHLEHIRGADMAGGVVETPESGLFLMIESLPFDFILNMTILIVITIFFVTSANSATYVLGVFSSKGDFDPKNKVLVTWGLLISAIAATFLFAGGLDGLEAMALVTGLPFALLIIAMVFSIYKYIRQEL